MVNPNRFYTYAYLREDRTPYYIGKGTGKRVYEKSNREIKPPKDKSRIIFLKQNLTEEEAFKHEIYMIAVFGRKDLRTGILRNRTDGGEGSSGAVRGEETKIRHSERMSGKNNPNYGKPRSEETKRKMSEANKGKNAGKNHPQYKKPKSEELKKRQSTVMKGRKWWNDGYGNSKLSIECPGEGWVLGMTEEHKRKNSEAKKGKNNPNYGKQGRK